MKISVIGPVFPYRGGISHFTTLLVKNLIQEGHNVQTISFKKQYPAWLFPGESDKDYSESREKVEAEFIITPLNPLTWAKAVKRINEFEPEKVVFPWWVTFWGPCFRFIIMSLRKHGIKTTALIHNVLPHETKFIDRFITKNTLKHADHYVVMAEKEKNRLLDILPESKGINVAPHPIYKMFPPTGMDPSVLREKLGLPEDKIIVLFFGIIRPYKGLSDLINAIKICHDENPDIHLIIAGEFWGDQKKYSQQIQNLGLEEVVHIFNYYIPDDEVAQFFEVADVFTAPYTGGTQSGAVKTALGFGLPIIATELIADEILSSLKNSVTIIPPEAPEELAKAILIMLSRKEQIDDSLSIDMDTSWQNFIQALI